MSSIPPLLLSAACYPPVMESEMQRFQSLSPVLFSHRALARDGSACRAEERSVFRQRRFELADDPRPSPGLSALRCAIARVAGQVDEFEHRAIGIAEIGARAVNDAALPVLLESDLDAACAQVI